MTLWKKPSYHMLCYAIHWKNWCWSWSWNSNILATWCEELTHQKRSQYWERLKAGGKGDIRGWEGWMTSPTQLTWAWASSGSWWWTGKPGMLQSVELQRVGHDWATELNWTTEDEMVGWHHWLNGHEFEQNPGDGKGQGGLLCRSPWGRKESDTT